MDLLVVDGRHFHNFWSSNSDRLQYWSHQCTGKCKKPTLFDLNTQFITINYLLFRFFLQYIKEWCNETIFETYGTVLTEGELDTFWAVVVSIFLIGGVIGSLGGAWLADKLGRYAFMCFN